MRHPLIILISHILLASSFSCSTMRDSVVLGIGVGGLVGGSVGAAAGSQHDRTGGGAAVGLIAGAALGGLLGYLTHKEDEQRKLSISSGPKSADGSPSLTRPEVRKIWIPEKIEADQYISGHYIYVIEKPSMWRNP